jgi:hypothetical protein
MRMQLLHHISAVCRAFAQLQVVQLGWSSICINVVAVLVAMVTSRAAAPVLQGMLPLPKTVRAFAVIGVLKSWKSMLLLVQSLCCMAVSSPVRLRLQHCTVSTVIVTVCDASYEVWPQYSHSAAQINPLPILWHVVAGFTPGNNLSCKQRYRQGTDQSVQISVEVAGRTLYDAAVTELHFLPTVNPSSSSLSLRLKPVATAVQHCKRKLPCSTAAELSSVQQPLAGVMHNRYA